MSRKYLTPLDLSKLELLNARIQNLASAPSSPVEGQIYYDTTLHQFGYYNNSIWVYVNSGSGDASTNTSSSVDGELVLFSGTTGKLLKRATGTGVVKATSGVFSANATINDLGAQTADYSANSHKITNLTDPSSAQDAATKAYVDATSAGIDWKASVRAATTANGTLSTAYANGQTIDGVTLATGDRILIKNQTTGSENGIYVVAASGAPTRATDADANAEVTGGLAVFVEEGTANADSGWVITNNGAITVGTTALVFTQFTGLGQVTAGTGLSKSGNTISFALVSGTDYAPATSGTSILKGNGSGGFSSAKFTATIGDGSTTAIAVTHSLGTKDVIAQVRDASTDAVVECDVTQTSTTVTTFTFSVAPATNAYKVVIIG